MYLLFSTVNTQPPTPPSSGVLLFLQSCFRPFPQQQTPQKLWEYLFDSTFEKLAKSDFLPTPPLIDTEAPQLGTPFFSQIAATRGTGSLPLKSVILCIRSLCDGSVNFLFLYPRKHRALSFLSVIAFDGNSIFLCWVCVFFYYKVLFFPFFQLCRTSGRSPSRKMFFFSLPPSRSLF